MKIISWNCGGAFRKKFHQLLNLEADILVVQECENPLSIQIESYKEFLSIYPFQKWQGTYSYKGLGIFSKNPLEILPWEKHLLTHFIPVSVECVDRERFKLLAVWACGSYIEEYAIYQDIHFDKYSKDMILIGDFNSNKKWDNKARLLNGRSHSNVITKLKEISLVSAYHYVSNEEHGEETVNTFYFQYNRNKGYHIDYCFVSKDKIKSFSILSFDEWLKHSDHLPIVLEI